jgi:hypothetical protein
MKKKIIGILIILLIMISTYSISGENQKYDEEIEGCFIIFGTIDNLIINDMGNLIVYEFDCKYVFVFGYSKFYGFEFGLLNDGYSMNIFKTNGPIHYVKYYLKGIINDNFIFTIQVLTSIDY